MLRAVNISCGYDKSPQINTPVGLSYDHREELVQREETGRLEGAG